MHVLDGRDIGCWFNISRRRAKTRFFGLHWTGGSDAGTNEEQARRVYNTLVSRGDSIHYVCCADGTFVQMCDLDAHAVHIGSAHNDDTIGCEFVCPGSSGVTPLVSRPKFQSTIHGSPVTYWGFTGAQVKAAADMSQAILWKYGISYLGAPVCVDDRKPDSFTKGVIGHFQVDTEQTKADPGPDTMFEVRSRMQDQMILGGGLWMAIGEGMRRFLIHYL